VIDNQITVAQNDTSSAGYSDLYKQGQLIFGQDGRTVQTPSGIWDLRSKMRIGDPSLNPSLLAISGNGHSEAHAEWDARSNHCFRLFLTDSVSNITQQLLGDYMPGSPTARTRSNTPFHIRYAALNYSGTKFLIQAESSHMLRPSGIELTWILWERESGAGWKLQTQYVTHENEFWPLTKQDPHTMRELEAVQDMAPICSVHKVFNDGFNL